MYRKSKVHKSNSPTLGELATMKEFGTLEYVLDIYSKNWTWKLTGSRAVSMVARVIPQAWYGDGPEEAIVPD
ncbi:MAG: hypothetical protein ACRDFB_05155, partial [Rhabdochlamydiaceae bacterium]